MSLGFDVDEGRKACAETQPHVQPDQLATHAHGAFINLHLPSRAEKIQRTQIIIIQGKSRLHVVDLRGERYHTSFHKLHC
jgi:hypothetical protein